MRFTLFQLNMQGGRFLDAIIEFIRCHDFDVVHFQEVSGAICADSGAGLGADCQRVLQEALPHYTSIHVTAWHENEDSQSYTGNTTLVSKKFSVLHNKVVWLNTFIPILDSQCATHETKPRCALSCAIEYNDTRIEVINTYIGVGPNVTRGSEVIQAHAFTQPFQLAQARQLGAHIQTLNFPFVISGDFNVSPFTELISYMNRFGRNLTSEYAITNTLNPRTFRAKHLFPPGVACDYVFVDPRVQVCEFKIVDTPTLSDHYGLILDCEL